LILRAYLKPNKGASCFCTYTQEETLPFIPEETEINQLIAALEAKELAATGFQYFTTMNDIQIFRKPKLFENV
jgi:hypothetical protein